MFSSCKLFDLLCISDLTQVFVTSNTQKINTLLDYYYYNPKNSIVMGNSV